MSEKPSSGNPSVPCWDGTDNTDNKAGSDRPEPIKVSASEFNRHQGSWLNKVIQGLRLTLFRNGKPAATIEAIQPALPLQKTPRLNDLQKELVDLTQKLDPEGQSLVEKVAISFIADELRAKSEISEKKWINKLNPGDLEMVVRIARSLVEDRLKSDHSF